MLEFVVVSLAAVVGWLLGRLTGRPVIGAPKVWQSRRNPELWWARHSDGRRSGPYPTRELAEHYLELEERAIWEADHGE